MNRATLCQDAATDDDDILYDKTSMINLLDLEFTVCDKLSCGRYDSIHTVTITWFWCN